MGIESRIWVEKSREKEKKLLSVIWHLVGFDEAVMLVLDAITLKAKRGILSKFIDLKCLLTG